MIIEGKGYKLIVEDVTTPTGIMRDVSCYVPKLVGEVFQVSGCMKETAVDFEDYLKRELYVQLKKALDKLEKELQDKEEELKSELNTIECEGTVDEKGNICIILPATYHKDCKKVEIEWYEKECVV